MRTNHSWRVYKSASSSLRWPTVSANIAPFPPCHCLSLPIEPNLLTRLLKRQLVAKSPQYVRLIIFYALIFR